MIDYGIRINLEGNAANRLKQITALQNELNAAIKKAASAQKEYDKAADNLKQTERDVKAINQQLRVMESQLTRAQNKLKATPWSKEQLSNVQQLSGSVREQRAELEAAMQAQREDQYVRDQAKTALDAEIQKRRELSLAVKNTRSEYSQERSAIERNTRLWEGSMSVLRGVVGIYGTVLGAIGTFSEDSEKLNEIQQKSVAVLTAMVGVQQLSVGWMKTAELRSALMVAATMKWNAAVATLTNTLKYAALAKSVLFGVGGFVIGGLVAGGVALSNYLSNRSKEREEQEKRIKEQEEFAQAVGEGAASAIAKYKELQALWNRLDESDEKRVRFIKKHKSALEELGAEINNVTDAERFFTQNESEFIDSMIRRGKASAYFSFMQKEISSNIARQQTRESLFKELQEIERKAASGEISLFEKPNMNKSGALGLSMSEWSKGLYPDLHLTKEGERKKEIENLLRNIDRENIKSSSKIQEYATQGADFSDKPGQIDGKALTSSISTDDFIRGVRGDGGVKNFNIEFNAPVVQVDSKNTAKQYTPEEMANIASNEFIQTIMQLATS